MTIGVYGLVAGIVKMDDAGLHLSLSKNGAVKLLGRILLSTAPKLMRFLSIAGTAAMFLVGGSIIIHGIPSLHHALAGVELWGAASLGGVGKLVVGLAFEALVGILAGVVCLAAFLLGKKLLRK